MLVRGARSTFDQRENPLLSHPNQMRWGSQRKLRGKRHFLACDWRASQVHDDRRIQDLIGLIANNDFMTCYIDCSLAFSYLKQQNVRRPTVGRQLFVFTWPHNTTTIRVRAPVKRNEPSWRDIIYPVTRAPMK